MKDCIWYRFLKEDYLQQNAFTKYDKYCPFYKSLGMLKNIVTFHKSATAAIEKTASGNAEGLKVTYNVIRQRLGDLLSKISGQKFEDPGKNTNTHIFLFPLSNILYLEYSLSLPLSAQGEDSLSGKLAALNEEIRDRFKGLEDEYR